MPATVLRSDQQLPNIEHPFRVTAGPGAGKTYWLTEHIRHVVRTSERLVPGARICCISYTNVAVNEIEARLQEVLDRVEVSTIHSFLYRHIVSPYVHLLRDENGEPLVNAALVDGHDVHYPTFPKLKQWFELCQVNINLYGDRSKDIAAYLMHYHWGLNEQQQPILIHSRPRPRPSTKLPEDQPRLLIYKSLFWQKGQIDHNDVLYLAYRILNEHPSLTKFLAAKFPYVFVDEFQDTNPIQTWIVQQIAQAGAIVGVIGDPEQSIYAFQGAKSTDFKQFQIPELQDYTINDNRRSTDSIITVLNRLRSDELTQQSFRQLIGLSVRLYVGTPHQTIEKIRQEIGRDTPLVVLARSNELVNQICTQDADAQSDPWTRLREIDLYRARFAEYTILGLEAAQAGSYGLAVDELLKLFRNPGGFLLPPFSNNQTITDTKRREVALGLLQMLIRETATFNQNTFFDAYQCILEYLAQHNLLLIRLTKGRAGKFAENTTWLQLRQTLQQTQVVQDVRTIHQAKAAEFDHVLVCFETAQDLMTRLTYPRGHAKHEEKRIVYVACSRARDRLWLNVPELSDRLQTYLAGLGIEINQDVFPENRE